MMEEIQNIGQPEDNPEVEVKELVSETETAEEQLEQEPKDAPEEESVEKDKGRLSVLWKALKEFLIKKKSIVLMILL